MQGLLEDVAPAGTARRVRDRCAGLSSIAAVAALMDAWRVPGGHA